MQSNTERGNMNSEMRKWMEFTTIIGESEMNWKEKALNKYPDIILSDCRISGIEVMGNDVKIDFSKDGFNIKSEKDKIYYHTGVSQIILENCDVENISIKLIKKNKISDESYIDILYDADLKDFYNKINLGNWKFVIVEEFYSTIGGIYIGRIRENKKSFWCFIKINFQNIVYLWNEIKFDYPVD